MAHIPEEGYIIIALIIFLLICVAIIILDEIYTRKYIRETRLETEKYIQENRTQTEEYIRKIG